MENPNLTIRAAKPTDVETIVPLIYSSGPKAWTFVFAEGKKTPLNFLTLSYVKRGNTVSYTNHYVAELNGKVVGSILSYTQPSFLTLTAGTALRILSVYKWKAPKVMARGLKTETIIQPPKSGCLYLGHIAVSETERNKGIAKKMIEYMITNNKKHKTISLDVSAENKPAISLYQNLGFEIKETRHPLGWEGIIPSHYYMEKQI
ncbi:GNAT family N-acetyltransferase [Leptospira sp. 2 VSF19]|uniref:GNAT family N-acetyltransferase n=1 Tax=Leptospira soteropolitanensis TaxID=2950025 RepID=A0AAW5VKQ3_9LEPT|nr:GNAT family N-acetyltransferase [Leptospira soteropolitanensis]MCW7491903.1 GNAT family N-acetyltransferase [Leptospira soteropolitanensis]MCW7499487.1 GNAT family N-acetyltransferase [Leptospira soteropolitanensis]MCW7520922.1 GNAT family N-acetyltransferase [Leptospira soteropolitanensis]MCW7525591.1 GNAT family N-acetyltransferase [Leptospira soteropolitanensis]MCW7529457.1 GNAT family N-acetyltransferase [Leptospira soteropolitanensis]